MHQLGQRGGVFEFAVNGIRNQLPQVLTHERCKNNIPHYRASSADCFELTHKRMGGIDFIVSVGTDQH